MIKLGITYTCTGKAAESVADTSSGRVQYMIIYGSTEVRQLLNSTVVLCEVETVELG